jgi:glyoxylase-like metal-dependent hydrolase (beta-lactamase superfamily II)
MPGFVPGIFCFERRNADSARTGELLMSDAKPAATSYSYKVGDAKITAVAEGERIAPLPDGFVVNATRDQVNGALAEAGMPLDQFHTIFTPIVIEIGGKRVLVDTGMGAAASKAPGSTVGLLTRNMAAAGIDPNSIDVVICSHFHGDHVNGLWAEPGKLSFPNATITVPAPEWKFWMDDGEMARAPKGRMEDLFKNNRRVFDPVKSKVETHEWDKEVVPGITAVGTPGHSAGHTSYVVSSGKDSVFVFCDVTNHPAVFVRHPDWHAAFDQDPVEAEKTRFKVLDMLVADKMPVQAFHFPFPGRAHIEKNSTGYHAVPVS